MCQFVACSGFQPVATTPVHGAVKYRAALRTDEMGITGAFATLAVLEAIISHGASQFVRAASVSVRPSAKVILHRREFRGTRTECRVRDLGQCVGGSGVHFM